MDPIQKILDLLRATRVTLFELHAVTADELGRNSGTLGWFVSDAAARLAAKDLGHSYWRITQHKDGVLLPNGDVFTLIGREITFEPTPRAWAQSYVTDHDITDAVQFTKILRAKYTISEASAKTIADDILLEQAALKGAWK